MSRTSGGNNIFEGRITGKSKIVKIHWKYVSFFAPRNRHVRQTIGNVMRAQRCRIEEISLKWKLLNFIGNMYHFWQTGAETVENVRFGEHPAGGPDR